MTRDTDSDWAKIAQTDPYWGVISVDDFKGKDLAPGTIDGFFAAGEVATAELFDDIEKHLAVRLRPRRSLDFGCGVGRLLLPIARRSKEAVGVDIAPGMLELARLHAGRLGVDNVELLLSDDGLSRLTGTFDFINCFIVLQHIPPVRGYRLISQLIDLLAPGGVISLHMTFARMRAGIHREVNRGAYYRREGEHVRDLAVDAGERESGAVTMYDYDLNEVFARLSGKAKGAMMVMETDEGGHLALKIAFRRPAEGGA